MSTGMEPVCPPLRLKQFEGVSMDEICFLILFPGRQII